MITKDTQRLNGGNSIFLIRILSWEASPMTLARRSSSRIALGFRFEHSLSQSLIYPSHFSSSLTLFISHQARLTSELLHPELVNRRIHGIRAMISRLVGFQVCTPLSVTGYYSMGSPSLTRRSSNISLLPAKLLSSYFPSFSYQTINFS